MNTVISNAICLSFYTMICKYARCMITSFNETLFITIIKNYM